MIRLKNCGVIAVPKTASRYVRACLVKGCTSLVADIKNAHYAHLTPDVDTNYGVVSFVRHPLPWLRSLWSHRRRKRWNWDLRYRLERECKSHTFEGFVKNICSIENIIDEYYECYHQKYRKNHDLQIGKAERVDEDLIGILDHFGETYDIDIIRNMPKNNVGRQLAQTDEWMKKAIYDSQQDFYKRYMYNEDI